MSGSARIQSPDVIRQFRGRYVAFNDSSRNALMGVSSALKRTEEWLKGEQQLYWKKELRKFENATNLAQNEYNRVKMSASGNASNAVIDAKKALDKMKRQKEEAQAKLEATKRWAVRLPAEVEKLVVCVKSLELLLDEAVPRGLSRLDGMVEALEEYLKTAPPEKS